MRNAKTHSLASFAIEKAKEIATMLNSCPEDDWTYKVVVSEVITGPYPAKIAVYDENNEFVAFFSYS